MKIENTVCCTILLFLCNMGETLGLLTHGNSVNVTDTIHGFPGHNVDLSDMMQVILNQTAELENLKQQAENDRSTIQLLLNKTNKLENFKRQAENDRITLQNRVFFLEAELNKLNVSKLPSSQEFSTYLKTINQLTQNFADNEANDNYVSQRLNDAFKALDDLKLKDMITTEQLLNQSVELEQQSS